MDDLAAFIEARLADDEMLSDELHRAEWCNSVDRDGGYEARRCDCGYPARVLREVAAKRKILHDHTPQAVGHRIVCSRCHYGNPLGANWPCLTMESLATAWNDHPDYRAEWATA
jgi:uncharacterized protein DUF6221